eukprot:108172-Prorocentrum_minimum.AAC.1
MVVRAPTAPIDSFACVSIKLLAASVAATSTVGSTESGRAVASAAKTGGSPLSEDEESRSVSGSGSSSVGVSPVNGLGASSLS